MWDWVQENVFGAANEHVQEQAGEGAKKALKPILLLMGAAIVYLLFFKKK